MATRQTRRPLGFPRGSAGLGVDASGGPVIDPTENVLSLVDVEKEHAKELREADTILQNALRDAETRRINELAQQKQTFDLELAKILRANSDSASLLLATQLAEVKRDLAERVAKLEQYRWETGGKGLGLNAAAGWVLSIIMATIALAALYLRR
jgi:hypothetical protein